MMECIICRQYLPIDDFYRHHSGRQKTCKTCWRKRYHEPHEPLNAAQTNKERHGKDFYVNIGAQGGYTSRGGGFAKNPELASIAGRLGGLKSKRRPKAKSEPKSIIDRIAGLWR